MRKVAPWQPVRRGHVRVYVQRANGDLLCLRRRTRPKDPHSPDSFQEGVQDWHHGGQWETVQGTILDSETPEETATRELFEETGFRATDWTEVAARTWVVQLADDAGDPTFAHDPDNEHDAWVWRPREVALQSFFGRDVAKARIVPIDSHDADGIVRRAGLDQKEWDALSKELSDLLGQAAASGVVRGLDELDIDSDQAFSLANADAIDFAADRAAELVGRRREGNQMLLTESPPPWAITETTREGLRDLVSKALEEGWAADRLQQEIEESALFGPVRASMIARTELAIAHSAGNAAAWRRSGVVRGKRWLLAPRHDDDDDCDVNAEAGVIPLDASFPSGDDMPPAHPNCLCAVIAVVGEDGT